MKILDIKIKVKCIELKTPFITALRRVDKIEFVRVYVRCDDGFVSVGEAPATKAITGEGIEEIVESINQVKENFYKKDIEESIKLLHTLKIGSSATSALDMAFVSLMAQESKKPLYKFLGAKKSVTLYTDITISFNSINEMLEDSIKAVDSGIDILKIKVAKDINHAIEVIRLISLKLPSAKLLVDANQAWTLQDSVFFIESLKDVEIELIEQPVIASDIESLKKITSASHIPILADEAVFTLDDAKKIIESKSADMINIKLMKCGGITKAVEILEYAKTKGVKCMLGSMLEGPYSINSALHLAMAYPDVIAYIDLDSPLLYKKFPTQLEFIYEVSKIVFNKKTIIYV